MELSFYPFMTKAIVLLFAALLPAVWMIAGVMRSGKVFIPDSRIFYAILSVPVAYVLSAVFANDKNKALLDFNFNTDSLIVILLGVLLSSSIILGVRNRRNFKKVAKVFPRILYLFAGLFVLQIVISKFNISSLSFLQTVTFVDSWMDLSAIFALLVIFLMYGGKKSGKYGVIFRSAIIIALLIFSGAVIYIANVFALLVLASFVYALKAFLSKPQNGGGILRLIPAIVVLIVSLLFVADKVVLQSRIVTTLQSLTGVSFVDVRPNWQGTLDVAKSVAKNSDWNTKLFGTGSGTFADQWRVHKPAEINETVFWNTVFTSGVGFIPTSVITGGVIMLISWLLFFIALFWFVIKTRLSMFGSMALFVWLYILLYPAGVAMILLGFALFGAMVAELVVNRRIKATVYNIKGESKDAFMAYIVIPVFVLLCVFSATVVVHRMVVNYYFEKASQLLLQGKMNDAELLLIRAKKWTDNAFIERSYTQIAFARLVDILKSAQIQESFYKELFKDTLTNVLSHAARAIKTDPYNPVNYILLGSISEQLALLNIEGAYDSAISAYKKAWELDTKNPALPLAIARIYSVSGDKQNAWKYVEESIKLKSNFDAAWYQYGLLALNEKDFEKAIVAFSNVVRVNANHANAMYYLSLLLAQKGQYKESLILMQRVGLLNPNNEDVKRNIAILKQKLQGIEEDAGNENASQSAPKPTTSD